MRKNIFFIIMASLVVLAACQTPEVLTVDNPTAGPNSFKATFTDGSGEFVPETPAPYKDGDVVTIVVPWYYPEDSNNETDITQMKLYASLPNSVKVEPGLGGIFDLTQSHHFTITSPDGSKSNITIKGERRKSSKKMVTEFSLSNGLSGFVFEDKKMIGLVPGGVDLANLTANIKVSPHATITPDPSVTQNFNNPVKYTITAHDGSTQEYTVQTFTPNKIAKGLRQGSAKELFNVRLGELGIPQANHWTTSMGVSSKYVFINTRDHDLTYIDRFSGKKVGTIALPFKSSLGNFAMASDEKDNLLISNLASAGGTLDIYRIKGTGAPEKYITYPGALASGRKVSISGSLDDDALILVSIYESSKVYYWKVVDGVLQSQVPQVYTADETKIKWRFVSDAGNLATDITAGLFMVGYGAINGAGYFNPDGSQHTAMNLTSLNIQASVNQGLDIKSFNNVNYLSMASALPNATTGYIFDVTSPAAIGDNLTNPAVGVYKTKDLVTDANTNSTADSYLKVSADGFKMVLYLMATNGGVAAYEFDCIDLSNL